MLHRLLFDTANPAESANVGAFLRDASGNLITSTLVGSAQAVDVNVAQASFQKAEDAAAVDGDVGAYVLAVRADARPSNANTSADGDYASIFVNASGELWVKDADTLAEVTLVKGDTASIVTSVASIDTKMSTVTSDLSTIITNTGNTATSVASIDTKMSTVTSDLSTIITNTGNTATNTSNIHSDLQALSHADAASFTAGDVGVAGLAVRTDSLSVLSEADGAYTPLRVNNKGELYVTIPDTVTVTTTDVALANSAISAEAETVTGSAAALIATPLSNRKYVDIYNNGSKPVFIGQSGVTTSSGFPVYPGGLLEARIGASVTVYAIASSGSQDVRVLQLS